MRYVSLLFLSAFVTTGQMAAGQTGLQNPNFEQGKMGQVPVGCFVPPAVQEAGYGVKLTADTPQKGGLCDLIASESPRPLTEQGRRNLIAFTRLLGYVRHFHPSDQAASADWNRIAVEGVKAVEDAKDTVELAARLEAHFRPYAPTLRVFPGDQTPEMPKDLVPPPGVKGLKIIRWRHLGFGDADKNPQRPNAYSSERERADTPDGKIPKDWPDPRKPERFSLGGGVDCLLSTALFADAEGTLPHAAVPDAKESASKPGDYSANDRAVRLAAIALGWNIFQHFYLYFDVVKTDWSSVLPEALSAAATDADARAFLDTLRRLVARLHDGHGSVSHATLSADFAVPPILVTWAENRLVVLQMAEKDAGGLKRGDVILKIDGKTTEQFAREREELISGATMQWVRYRLRPWMLLGPTGSMVTLEVQRGTEPPFTVTLNRSAAPASMLQETRPAAIEEIRPGIWYVDLDTRRAKMDEFQKALPKLEKAKGIVFDMRGYPNEVAMQVLPLVADKPITSANFLIPIITRPNGQGVTYVNGAWPPFGPNAPHLKARIAFLTDGRAISYAESIMGIVEHYKLGEIVGGPTAGTNGNINPFTLPGGYRIVWTGMKVIKHDGSTHHGVGIQPTVSVSPTVAGIAAGRDEVLEKAIDVVSK